jgi:hypothetical protein
MNHYLNLLFYCFYPTISIPYDSYYYSIHNNSKINNSIFNHHEYFDYFNNCYYTYHTCLNLLLFFNCYFSFIIILIKINFDYKLNN